MNWQKASRTLAFCFSAWAGSLLPHKEFLENKVNLLRDFSNFKPKHTINAIRNTHYP
ncbi:hypothetical protein SAMN03080617_03714 [Algoriphagus alkaliphilus]|uniref:Uncharacterized protein n=1 Tax=Algoriphagus alkaliphilus TaxID=279824 RepID=A0A1G5ZFJ6_9BACT|nr:hypothetical protein SAMN03080617_03714 [Algoriphagus alkaliphilus]